MKKSLFICLSFFINQYLWAQQPLFQEVEIKFKSVGEIDIFGTLVLPNSAGPHAAVVLLDGSNRGDRRSYYRSAKYFASQGIAALCFDSPGTGKSTGDRIARTMEERARDAIAAIHALQEREEVRKNAVGLWGMSQGGWVVYQAVAEAPGDIAFGISISGPAVSMFTQSQYVLKNRCIAWRLTEVETKKTLTLFRLLKGTFFTEDVLDYQALKREVGKWEDVTWGALIDLVNHRKEKSKEELKEQFFQLIKNWEEERWFKIMSMFVTRGMKPNAFTAEEFIKEFFHPGRIGKQDFDPVLFLEKIRCPMLCIFGENDRHLDAPESVAILEKIFTRTKHPDYTIKMYAHANHGIQLRHGNRFRYPEGYPQVVVEWVKERFLEENSDEVIQ